MKKALQQSPGDVVAAKARGERESPGADPVVDEAIGRQLKQLFNEVASEPVPDRFAELLKQLEDREGGKGSS